MNKRICVTALIGAAAALALPGMALAVDGQVLITQARAMAGGVTAGDTAGFPVTISEPGSYKLGSDLVVPDGNTTAILITTSHVTIDLNGFAILGPADCSGGFPCSGAGNGSGSGIATGPSVTPQFNITIRNGTIQGMGGVGVGLEGDSHLVEQLHVRSNGDNGIDIGASADAGLSIVQNNMVQRNGRNGIRIGGGTVRHNVVTTNASNGIATFGTASLLYNTVTRNGESGLNMANPFAPAPSKTGYVGNILSDNVQGSIAFGDAHNLGQNLCNGVLCP